MQEFFDIFSVFSKKQASFMWQNRYKSFKAFVGVALGSFFRFATACLEQGPALTEVKNNRIFSSADCGTMWALSPTGWNFYKVRAGIHFESIEPSGTVRCSQPFWQ